MPISAAASPTPAPESRVLLHGVSGLALTYLHPDLGWVAGWDDSAPGDLPLAVRVVMDIEGFGRLERVVELPGDRS